ncbi:MAG: hypothetical protein MI674_01820, partial [Cytophagales bacterium]|nr:hypothetical protein [Cytophagales bacterium]
MTNKLKSNLKQTLCGVLVAVAVLASCTKKNEGDNVGPQTPQAGAGDGNPGVGGDGNPGVGGSDGDH